MNKKQILTTIIFLLTVNFVFSEKIVFSANSMTGKSGDSNTTTRLNGNAYIKAETMEIQADSVVLSGDEYRYITATGSVHGKNMETNMDFVCEELSYDRITKIAELKGDVDLTDNDNDVRAKAQIIIYDQDKDVAILQAKINLTQKDNVCSGSYAVYYKKDQILELSGNAQIKQNDDTFRAQQITLDMDTQDITLGGNVKGTVVDSKEKEDLTEEETEESEDKTGENISEDEEQNNE